MVSRFSYVHFQKSDVIPSLPKPKSSVSPKLGRSTPTNHTETKPSNGSADLLGLDTSKPETKNDDIFSSFFSAEKPPDPKPEEQKQDLKTEEENFFNQPAPSEKEKSKLTKDSILALYSQTPSANIGNQFGPPAYQFGAYQTPSGSAQYNNMSQNVPVQQNMQNIPVQNGMQFNQFQGMNFQQPFGMQQPMQQPMQGQFQSQQFFNQPAAPVNSQPLNQPLSQQFGGLNLGQNFPNAFAPSNVASNTTWQ